ncbi:coagulation factor XI-like [Boleophthalmus pectinirostris]|uniref:coagulation factor XI-like n=1 Tax=Boleophthalmus pectinirostris TaxID=150288 RepID=UPI002430B645|nr:coagulation factor XI-like [Boleophthalmus pectinirostris]
MGTVVDTMSASEATHCQLLCTQHPLCHFFMFSTQKYTDSKDRFKCELKQTSSGEPLAKAQIPNVTSGYSLLPCPDLYPNVAFIQSNYRLLFTPDALECQRVCTHDPDCSFFTWTSPQHKDQASRLMCSLMFSWKVPRIRRVELVDRATSGFNDKKDFRISNVITDCAVTLLSDTDFRQGSTLLSKEPAVSPGHCQTLCSAHPLCTHYTYDRPYCYILQRTNSASTNSAGLISGVPSRFCQQDSSWVTELYPGLAFPGSNIKMVNVDDVEGCRKACSETPPCRFFTVNIKNSNISVPLRGFCFLKAVLTVPAPEKIQEVENMVSGFSLRGQ